MKYIWIEAQGTKCESEMSDFLSEYFRDGLLYIACFTDRFESGIADKAAVSGISLESLLEIRIFNNEVELLARRSHINGDFYWRIASDRARTQNFKHIKANEPDNDLPEKEEMTYFIQYQQLDINREKSKGSKLISTVGGRYSLPLNGNENAAKLMIYMVYDERGMAAAADFRICGFEERNVEVRDYG